ncbi:MAG: hemolysin family protein [Chloroflexota bacterium]|nr:hemolysin family protein [Chloroflexota bacterium]
MSGESWGDLFVVVIAIGVMTLAAAVETFSAVINKNKNRQRQSSEVSEGRRRSVQLQIDPPRLLSGALLTIEIAAVSVAASLLTSVVAREAGRGGLPVAVVTVTVLFLVLGQGLPRAIGRRRPERAVAALIAVGTALSVVTGPIGHAIDRVSRGFAWSMRGEPDESIPIGTEDELRAVNLRDNDDEVIESEEQEMIDGVMHLEEIRVRDIMVPRVDITAVPRSIAPRALIETITANGHSRIPVFAGSIDNIVGILYAKDLLPFVMSNNEVLPLISLLREPYVVPESKRIDDLLTELRQAKIHIAIVADEYGGTAGLVTIEDILEEIVGEIQDEYDTEAPLFELVGPDELIADGRLALEDVEDTLRVTFEKEDYGTLGGFVQRHLSRVPEEGDAFEAAGLRVEILEVERHRVRKCRVSKVSLMSEGVSGEPEAEVAAQTETPSPRTG